MKTNPALQDYRSQLVAFKIDLLKTKVSYYKNSFLPDYKEYSGISQGEALSRAEEELENFIYDHRTTEEVKYLNLTSSEILNCIRVYAIENRQTAIDFSDNVFLKIRSLRKTVKACQLLIELEPRLNMYSFHWLAGRNPITIQ